MEHSDDFVDMSNFQVNIKRPEIMGLDQSQSISKQIIIEAHQYEEENDELDSSRKPESSIATSNNILPSSINLKSEPSMPAIQISEHRCEDDLNSTLTKIDVGS